MLDDQHWFTEIHAQQGCAFSLQIRRKLHDEQTPFQRIEIFDTESFGKLMVIDGCTMVSGRDNYLYWNAGITLGFSDNFSLDLRYWDTDEHSFGKIYDSRVALAAKVTF